MSFPDPLPPEAGLVITALSATADLVAIAARTHGPAATCPCCNLPPDRIHSHYPRTAADLPWQGRRVILRVTVRRFRCATAGCKRTVFCERLPAIATFARTTARLTDGH